MEQSVHISWWVTIGLLRVVLTGPLNSGNVYPWNPILFVVHNIFVLCLTKPVGIFVGLISVKRTKKIISKSFFVFWVRRAGYSRGRAFFMAQTIADWRETPQLNIVEMLFVIYVNVRCIYAS